MDITEFIGPVITGLVTFAGILVTNSKTQAVTSERMEQYKTHSDMRIDELAKHVEKHNNIIERTYKLESDMATAFVRLDEVRADVRELRDKVA